MSGATADLAAEVASARWYHGMELPGGIRTPGDYDLTDTAGRIPFPTSLTGKRCLDVGTRDGFWAFEMERRGASEVLAIDLDDPDELDFPQPRQRLDTATRESLGRREPAFYIAHRALGSTVERRDLSVYALSPELVGRFDFAFIGTLLLHLRNPVDGLAAIRRVLKADGVLMSNDAVSLPLTLLRPRTPTAEVVMQARRPYWFVPNAAARRQIVAAAGYEIERSGGPYFMRYGAGWEPPAGPSGLRFAVQRAALRLGAPHSWIIARPHPDASPA